MNITSKFIYSLTRTAFERELPNIPEGLEPIVFIEDTKEVWTHGTYFSLGYPRISISEISGIINVQVGDDTFTIQTSGSSLGIRKGIGNSIIISSDALTSVNTEDPLEWKDDTKKLIHKTSGVSVGQYGQVSSLSNASIFYIPNIIVDSFGHITEIKNTTIAIRDYVEQLAPSLIPADRSILLSYNEVNNASETAQVRKASGLTYNDATKKLKVAGGIEANDDIIVNDGDLKVVGGLIIGDLQGNVTGEATPKIHLSDIPEYGGASLNLYGHVKLQDELNEEPPPSSDNADVGSAVVTRGIAATPKMVWDVQKKIMVDLSEKPSIKGFVVGSDILEITQPEQLVTVEGNNGVQVSLSSDGFIVSGREISGYDESNNLKQIDNIKFSKDFSFNVDNEMQIRWEEIH